MPVGKAEKKDIEFFFAGFLLVLSVTMAHPWLHLTSYGASNMRLRDLKGLGIKSEEDLSKVGINTIEEFMNADPFDLYKKLKETVPGISLNFLYAMIGAQEGKDWREISKARRTEILLQLDDLGIAPK